MHACSAMKHVTANTSSMRAHRSLHASVPPRPTGEDSLQEGRQWLAAQDGRRWQVHVSAAFVLVLVLAGRRERHRCSQRKPTRRSLHEATTYSIIHHSRLLYLQEARSTILDRKCKETKASIKLSKRRFIYVIGVTRQQGKNNTYFI